MLRSLGDLHVSYSQFVLTRFEGTMFLRGSIRTLAVHLTSETVSIKLGIAEEVVEQPSNKTVLNQFIFRNDPT